MSRAVTSAETGRTDFHDFGQHLLECLAGFGDQAWIGGDAVQNAPRRRFAYLADVRRIRKNSLSNLVSYQPSAFSDQI